MNIFPCPASGVWECERTGDCSTNFTLPNFGILLRDTQLPGDKKEGIGLADPNAPNTPGSTVTVSAGIAATSAASSSAQTVSKSQNHSDALAVGLGVGIPLGLLLVACVALLFLQQRKLKGGRAVAPRLEGSSNEKGRENKRAYSRTYNAQELPEGHGAVLELSDNKDNVQELGGHYMPGSPPRPPPLSK